MSNKTWKDYPKAATTAASATSSVLPEQRELHGRIVERGELSKQDLERIVANKGADVFGGAEMRQWAQTVLAGIGAAPPAAAMTAPAAVFEYRFKTPDTPTPTVGDKERRTFSQPIELRNEGEVAKIEGYAAVFDSDSEVMWGEWTERIAKGAFDNTDMSDVRALFNHDPNFVLGRTTNNTLTLSIDERGLKYSITPPDTQWARDLTESIRRGDISQSSFGFTIEPGETQWDFDVEPAVRYVKKIQRLFDVSPVTYPAYTETEVSARSRDAMAKQNKEQQQGKEQKETDTSAMQMLKMRARVAEIV